MGSLRTPLQSHCDKLSLWGNHTQSSVCCLKFAFSFLPSVKSRTGQQTKIKWVVNIVYYILQAVLMISLIWKYYADPVTVLPSKWISPLERMVAFPSGVAGGVGITCWLVVCNKVVAIILQAVA
ncbi:unnamed protein product [Oncorhynchus mykiss]|uniref:Uncharacterized protein n=1 Tax=Oncorhynchus mykiss TaxID=8022 RepID=A0A060Z6J2_ONCMY|nr:unnamed protein product [Oncorhynchus mykiss]